MKMRKIFLVASLAFLMPLTVFAQATLSVSPTNGAYKIGELFSVLVKVNTAGKAINAATGEINFDNQKLDIVSMGYTSSIFSLWPEEPVYSNAGGTIRFSGGTPSPGFNGSSGSVLRITFKPKAEGNAQIIFNSGSILANDGLGTNILEGLKGGGFNIVATAKPPELGTPVSPPEESIPPTSFTSVDRQISAPTITEWPTQLEEGLVLSVKGLAYPNGKVLIFVQKGAGEPMVEERFAGVDGRFSYSFSKTVTAGLYRVWVKSVSPEGVVSSSSDIATVEVTKPLFFRLGTIAVNYTSIILTLLALVLMLLITLMMIWLRIRKWQARRGVEIHEAEKALHEGFQKLQTGLQKYIHYLTSAKSIEGVRRKENKTEGELAEELKDIEGSIEKEINDIQ